MYAALFALALLLLILAVSKRNQRLARAFTTTLPVIDRPSPNFNSRNGNPVTVLVLHYTAIADVETSIRVLSTPGKNAVSSHYVIGNDGTIYRLVDESNRAWHAGVSQWSGQGDINTVSIGIEINNLENTPYSQAQMDAVIALCKDIAARYNLASHQIIGHSDVAPSRKQDPGAYFDWKALAQAGLGIWPQPEQQDYDRSANWGEDDYAQALQQYGYTDGSDFVTKLTAFQRHFQPEVFITDTANQGKINTEAGARLACLLRMIGNN